MRLSKLTKLFRGKMLQIFWVWFLLLVPVPVVKVYVVFESFLAFSQIIREVQ